MLCMFCSISRSNKRTPTKNNTHMWANATQNTKSHRLKPHPYLSRRSFAYISEESQSIQSNTVRWHPPQDTTMSWLRTSPLRQSFSRSNRNNNSSNNNSGRPLDGNGLDFDQKACYDSFCKHWQQVYEIILRAEVSQSRCNLIKAIVI